MHHTQKIQGKRQSPRKHWKRPHALCLNCNKSGHLYRECSHPLTSFGVLLCRYDEADATLQYLMICRRHTFGYIECVRTCYNVADRDYVKQLLSEMTITERRKIDTFDFKELWLDVWQKRSSVYSREYKVARQKFARLRGSNMFRTLLRTMPASVWEVPEWGFPKGKRNFQESARQCAFREMEEETGIGCNRFTQLSAPGVLPPYVVEKFQGTDGKLYRHVYYICQHAPVVETATAAATTTAIDANANATAEKKGTVPAEIYHHPHVSTFREVSDIAWMTYDDCMRNIRFYNVGKSKMFASIHPKILHYYENVVIKTRPA